MAGIGIEYVAIVGSRYPANPGECQKQIVEIVKSLPETTVFVSGCCPSGIDYLVHQAVMRERTFIKCYAPWERFEKSAGPRRNAAIAKIADRVVAFTNGGPGTTNCIHQFELLGKPQDVRWVK